MIIALLVIWGLALGSFANALIWRIYQQAQSSELRAKSKKKSKQSSAKSSAGYSILKGRSMCPNCKHQLAAKDLIPVFSWLQLRGKCRYCGRSISWQYPLVELATALLFVVSYVFWPLDFDGYGIILFTFWLVFLVGFVALAVYDLKWMLLPNRIVYPLIALAILQWLIIMAIFGNQRHVLTDAFFSIAIAGGLFYALFQISGGTWIGGGDVKLGLLLGIILASPTKSLLMLFVASLIGSLVAIPMLITGRAQKGTRLPFGPFLLMAAIIVQLFGAGLIAWYERQFLLYSWIIIQGVA